MEYWSQIWPPIAAWFARHGRLFRNLGAIAGGLVLAALLGIALLPYALGLIAPKLDLHQDLYAANRPIAITFLDQSGATVGHRGAIVGERLALKDMPAYLPAAFIAMEDRSFWSNPGFDLKGLTRATLLNLRARHVVAGGSTITQQVAKIVFTNQARTMGRKFQELLDAAALNKSLSKQQILELYLNRIYLGSGAYGVDGASRIYFGVSAKNLTLAQAAMLATLTRAPSVFSPRNDLAAAQKRAIVVLKAMVDTGAIKQADADEAIAHPAEIIDRSTADARNFYFDAAAEEARDLASNAGHPPSGDLIVTTTFEPRVQEAARKAVARVLAKSGQAKNAHEAAVVVMKLDGAVAALIGGQDYDESTFNRATQAHRQPGSSFKPFVYLAALEQGVTPWDLRDDEPIDIGGWSPTNYGGEQFGTITVAEALAHSVNTITVALEQQVGVSSVIAAARRCGITSPLEANATLALGTSEVTPLELTGAYATFANGGVRVAPYLVTQVEDNAGHVLYTRPQPEPKRVIADNINRDLTAMLYDVIQMGTGRKAEIAGHQAAGKTGTTSDYHDAWFEGFTADYVTGVWVGNDDSSAMRGVTGGSLPAEIWRQVMLAAEKGMAPTPLAMSSPNPPATDENGEIMLGSGENGQQGQFVDDEARDAASARDNNRAPSPVHHFWDWLFGRDDRPKPSDSNGNGGDNSVPPPPQAPNGPPPGEPKDQRQ